MVVCVRCACARCLSARCMSGAVVLWRVLPDLGRRLTRSKICSNDVIRYRARGAVPDKHEPPMLRVYDKAAAPVGGIPVTDHFEVNLMPLSVAVTKYHVDQLTAFFALEAGAGVGADSNDAAAAAPGGGPAIDRAVFRRPSTMLADEENDSGGGAGDANDDTSTTAANAAQEASLAPPTGSSPVAPPRRHRDRDRDRQQPSGLGTLLVSTVDLFDAVDGNVTAAASGYTHKRAGSDGELKSHRRTGSGGDGDVTPLQGVDSVAPATSPLPSFNTRRRNSFHGDLSDLRLKAAAAAGAATAKIKSPVGQQAASSLSVDPPSALTRRPSKKFARTRVLASMSREDQVADMKTRARANQSFVYVKVPSFVICATYKGGIVDLTNLVVTLPVLEYHNKTLAWSALLEQIRSDCSGHVYGAFFKGKVLRMGTEVGGGGSVQQLHALSRATEEASPASVRAREVVLFGSEKEKVKRDKKKEKAERKELKKAAKAKMVKTGSQGSGLLGRFFSKLQAGSGNGSSSNSSSSSAAGGGEDDAGSDTDTDTGHRHRHEQCTDVLTHC